MSKQPTAKRSANAALAATGKPSSLQVGALCWRKAKNDAIKILLISSRDTGRWVIPKGWPMRQRTEAGAAEREAYEEAGVRGTIGARSIGMFGYLKGLGKGRSIHCIVRVFPLEVSEMLRKYPEIGQRRVKWFSRAKAARKVGEPDLSALIRRFDPDQGIAETADNPPA